METQTIASAFCTGAVSTLPIRNGNFTGPDLPVLRRRRKYLTYKEWKLDIEFISINTTVL